jgi:hypothetical protein
MFTFDFVMPERIRIFQATFNKLYPGLYTDHGRCCVESATRSKSSTKER